MSELQLISDAMAEVGKAYVSLDFEDHPIWDKVKSLSTETTSIALIDNTTVHNALILMQEGLGAEDSCHAMLDNKDLVCLF